VIQGNYYYYYYFILAQSTYCWPSSHPEPGQAKPLCYVGVFDRDVCRFPISLCFYGKVFEFTSLCKESPSHSFFLVTFLIISSSLVRCIYYMTSPNIH
jgi:hypothetical protein